MTGTTGNAALVAAAAKAHCFDIRIAADQLQAAWDRALDPEHGNRIIRSFAASGMTPWSLPVHLIDDLMSRYGESL